MSTPKLRHDGHGDRDDRDDHDVILCFKAPVQMVAPDRRTRMEIPCGNDHV